MTVASEILSQLGGSKFLAMTGAKNLLNGGNYLQFDIKGKGFNKARVTLTGNDDYTIAFYQYSRKHLTCNEVDSVGGIYAETLKAHFEARSGLYLSL